MLSLLLLTTLASQDTAPEFAHSTFETGSPDQLLSLVDMTGDGRLELVLYTGFGIQVQAFGSNDKLSPAPLANYSWDAESVAWTLVDLEGDGQVELVTLEDSEQAIVHRLGEQGFERQELLTHKADVPRGIYRMDFLRDVNGDGRQDIVLPQLGQFAIFIQAEAGGWNEPLKIQYETRVDLEVGSPEELGSEFGQEIQVPWFDLRDVDGDGIQDLVSKSATKIRFHLGEPEISPTPSWTLNLAALSAELPPDDGVDFDNLLGVAARGVDWKLVDLDGEQPNELILRIGSKFRIYSGGARSGPVGAPSQVLKSSGNVLLFILRNVLGDSAPELQLLRGEKLGLGQVIRWLVLPGSVDFDVFTYQNQGGVFSRRPTRRNKLTLGIPRILAFMDRMEEFEEEQEEKSSIPARRIALDADEQADDVLDVVGQELLIFSNVLAAADQRPESVELNPEAAINSFFEIHVDSLGESGSKTFHLGDVEKWVRFEGALLRESCAEKAPNLRLPLGQGLSEARIRVLDLNHNGRDDFIVLGHPTGEEEAPMRSPLWLLHFFVH